MFWYVPTDIEYVEWLLTLLGDVAVWTAQNIVWST